jgi:ubiquinone/menaquinone biosynthesis C-methylase UbiE
MAAGDRGPGRASGYSSPMTEPSDTDWGAKRRTEAERVKRVYRARGDHNNLSRYSRAALMALQERERYFLEELARRGMDPANLDCLDVGCGAGGQLARLVGYGADPGRLHGIDMGDEALAAARARLPLSDLVAGDASEMPFVTDSMDVVMQQTVLSSILDHDVRRLTAAEMVRVCRPTGLIVSYDFILNPTNPDTRGVPAAELRKLFVGCEIRVRRVTLAPPIARRVAPRSRHLAAALGTLPILRTHLIAFITPPA